MSVTLLCTAISLSAQVDDGFKTRAFEHVRFLAGLGHRMAGTEGEAKAIQYAREQFEKIGLRATVEPFECESFEFESASLTVGEKKFDVSGVIFNPYDGLELRAPVVVIPEATVKDRAALAALDTAGKIVVAASNIPSLAGRPKALALIRSADTAAVNGEEGVLAVTGKRGRLKSANLVAILPASTDTTRNVIVSAHIDSVDTPGAHDNASGVGVMIELARHFRGREKPLPFNLRFIAFGAEEIGMLGAKAYLKAHLDELKLCDLLFNIDSVGGNEQTFIEMRSGVEGVAGRGVNQLSAGQMDRATADPRNRWMLPIRDQMGVFASNAPGWLRTAIIDTNKELGHEFRQASYMGSDVRVFAQAGIPATNLAISGGVKSHTKEDTPEHIHQPSLEVAGRIVAGVVDRVP